MYTRRPSSLVDFMWKSVAEMLTSHIIVKSENQNPRLQNPRLHMVGGIWSPS
jgi:hypothetical protein